MLIALLLVLPVSSLEPKFLRGSHKIDTHLFPSSEKNANALLAFRDYHKHIQPSGIVTVTHESFFSRLSSSLGEIVLGFVLIAFSVPVIWLNEKRNAQYETLIGRGEQACKEIIDGEYDSKNNDSLVHAIAKTSSITAVEDPLFNVRFDSGVMKLSRCVEIYQWQEHEHEKTEETETVGGGKETKTITSYTYEKKWLSTYNNGKRFNEADGHTNKKPAGIDSGSNEKTCELVHFGAGFSLTRAELSQLGSGTSLNTADNGFPERLICKKNEKLQFVDGNDGYLYAREGGQVDVGSESEIGDVRVQFYALKDCDVTVMGLQYMGEGQKKAAFLPFRMIQRPICACSGLSEEQEKELLRKEADKTPEEFASEAVWSGWGWCFCCPCNLVAMCFAAAMRPEIHHAHLGSVSKTECFGRMKGAATAQKWIIRVIGWLIMFIGLWSLFAPFTRLWKVLPFIGPFLSSFGGAITGVFSFIVTIIVAIFIISLSYLVYHPCLGMIAFGCLACVIAGVMVLSHVLTKPHTA